MRHNMRHMRHMSTSESVGAFFGFLTFELGSLKIVTSEFVLLISVRGRQDFLLGRIDHRYDHRSRAAITFVEG